MILIFRFLLSGQFFYSWPTLGRFPKPLFRSWTCYWRYALFRLTVAQPTITLGPKETVPMSCLGFGRTWPTVAYIVLLYCYDFNIEIIHYYHHPRRHYYRRYYIIVTSTRPDNKSWQFLLLTSCKQWLHLYTAGHWIGLHWELIFQRCRLRFVISTALYRVVQLKWSQKK